MRFCYLSEPQTGRDERDDSGSGGALEGVTRRWFKQFGVVKAC